MFSDDQEVAEEREEEEWVYISISSLNCLNQVIY